MRSLKQVLTTILNHPLNRNHKPAAFFRFLKWQIKSRLGSKPMIVPFTSRTKLEVRRGMTGATGNIYCGLHEFEDMSFLLHFLRKDDLFVDVGANIGSYVVLASGHLAAKTYCFEPVPETFGFLKRNIDVNEITDKVQPFNNAVGASEGKISFTSSEDTQNHVATPSDKNVINVMVVTLDGALSGACPVLMKIDVEGYETDVLRGAENTLANPELKAIIIELNGSGERYGYDEEKIHQLLRAHGFMPYIYFPFERKLVAVEKFGSHNTIYIRQEDFVIERLKTAESVSVRNREF